MLLPTEEAHAVVRTTKSDILLLTLDSAGIEYTGY